MLEILNLGLSVLFLVTMVYSMLRTRSLVRKTREFREHANSIFSRYDKLLMDLTMENMALRSRLGIKGPIAVPLESLTEIPDKESFH